MSISEKITVNTFLFSVTAVILMILVGFYIVFFTGTPINPAYILQDGNIQDYNISEHRESNSSYSDVFGSGYAYTNSDGRIHYVDYNERIIYNRLNKYDRAVFETDTYDVSRYS